MSTQTKLRRFTASPPASREILTFGFQADRKGCNSAPQRNTEASECHYTQQYTYVRILRRRGQDWTQAPCLSRGEWTNRWSRAPLLNSASQYRGAGTWPRGGGPPNGRLGGSGPTEQAAQCRSPSTQAPGTQATVPPGRACAVRHCGGGFTGALRATTAHAPGVALYECVR